MHLDWLSPYSNSFSRLKEEIKAKTLQSVIGLQIVNPVRHISKLRYDRSDAKDGRGDFYQALEKAKADVNKPKSSGEKLEQMSGMNQYDKNAMERFFSMHSDTDFKC